MPLTTEQKAALVREAAASDQIEKFIDEFQQGFVDEIMIAHPTLDLDDAVDLCCELMPRVLRAAANRV